MKILIIEDNAFKSDKIIEFLVSLGVSEIQLASSYHSALKVLLSPSDFDLILLDISIPHFDFGNGGGDFLPSGGKYLFNQIYMNDISTKVIVVTLYKNFDDGENIDNLNFHFESNYGEIYLGYILFNIDDLNWQSDLKNKINNML